MSKRLDGGEFEFSFARACLVLVELGPGRKKTWFLHKLV
jgi:hypothetical protein